MLWLDGLKFCDSPFWKVLVYWMEIPQHCKPSVAHWMIARWLGFFFGKAPHHQHFFCFGNIDPGSINTLVISSRSVTTFLACKAPNIQAGRWDSSSCIFSKATTTKRFAGRVPRKTEPFRECFFFYEELLMSSTALVYANSTCFSLVSQ